LTFVNFSKIYWKDDDSWCDSIHRQCLFKM
jgi:hypothetical protein